MSSPAAMPTLTKASNFVTPLVGASLDSIIKPSDNNHVLPPDEQEQDQVLKKIRSFWGSGSGKLRIQVSDSLRTSKKFRQVLKETLLPNAYWFELDLLVIRDMRPVHGSLARFAGECHQRLKQQMLTSEERDCVYLGGSDVTFLQGMIPGLGKKPQTYRKAPDQSYTMTNPQTGVRIQTVMFEAGFSESYHDLARDMKHWLLNSSGRVQLVVLANIQEDRRTLITQQKTEEFKDNMANLLIEFGNTYGKANHADLLERATKACTKQETNTMAAYEKCYQEVKTDDWVGPITAALEFWELDDSSEPHKRGETVHVFPGPVVGSLPPIYISDIIHPRCHESFPSFDSSRRLDLDPCGFVKALTDGIKDLAVIRAHDLIWPDPPDKGDYDFEE
ncbi:hypothetical protein BO70DRAFT_425150 [Aspergillus heteromorphus CBS 117.55]|uniref:Uncharacterized protein n=1 Tax=Aspergillus heteromorphus CBS 117.55 TaxID=1448321 RepID=A0A317X4C7_9EURO|nr:uncharacterized protein BO70DRAFT_425150 [Aspergillus heteromorphus CBS 117.55]PWY92452.1 hypothetical protein BO70DRAFT_425150 [Aspergillus heteromorphus CBS 117.55]